MNAIGLLELRSIARGIETGDAMLKAATVKLIQSAPVCSGKYVVIIFGDVGDVTAAISAGKAVGKELVIDELIIANIHPDVSPALMAATRLEKVEAVGIIETLTCAAGIIAADYAAKTGDVKLMEIRIARGLGGKAYVTLCGEVGAVRAAVDAGGNSVAPKGLLLHTVVIPSIHPDMAQNLL